MEGQRRGRRAWWGWRVGVRPRRRTVDGSGPRQRARGCREEMRVYSKCKGIGEQWVRGGPPSCLLLSPSERSRHTTGKAADSSTGFSSGTRGGYRGVRVLHRSWSWELGSGSKAECERGVGRGMAFRGAGVALGTWQVQRSGSQRRCLGTVRPTPPSTSALTCTGSPCKDRQGDGCVCLLEGRLGAGEVGVTCHWGLGRWGVTCH